MESKCQKLVYASYIPKPLGMQPSANALQTQGAAPYVSYLLVSPHVGGGERGHKHGISQRLVTGGVDHVSQSLLRVLDASALRVTVAEEDELLLLACPQPSHTLFIDLNGNVKYYQ